MIHLLGALALAWLSQTGTPHWIATHPKNDPSLLEIAYGVGDDNPQYAVLDLKSGYFRGVCSRTCGWGTSVIVMPVFWTGGQLVQGYPVTATFKQKHGDAVVKVHGESHGVTTTTELTIHPPKDDVLAIDVSARTQGTAPLDTRAGEAFKMVFLSSMHESDSSWDSQWLSVGEKRGEFPAEGWIVAPNPPVRVKEFVLHGGDSQWKPQSPSVGVRFSTPVQVAGWLTGSSDPNDDNVGFWAASDRVEKAWRYRLTIEKQKTR